MNLTYDIAIVGAGIAGSALACSLATAVKYEELTCNASAFKGGRSK